METLASGSSVIYCDTGNAILRYVARITDTTKFTPLFADALGWLLASYLAGPLIKGDVGAAAGRECFKVFQGQLANAAGSDSRQRRVADHHVPSSISARGGTGSRFRTDLRVRR